MKRKLEVIVSPHTGYCFGVKRAMRLIDQGLECFGGTIYTLGDIIHNPPEVARLKARGVLSVESLDEVEEGGTLVIRAHGVHPDVMREIQRRGFKFLDATCPFVQRSQHFVKLFSEEARPVIIVGDRQHPEVKGIAGHAGSTAIIVRDPAEAERIAPLETAGVVIQTTYSRDEAERVIDVLARKIPILHVRDTICQATEARREATIALARQVDLVLVVGGRNSSNTKRLFQVCADAGVAARFVESPEEIVPSWFPGVKRVGLTTGTSTPAWLIDAVLERLRSISEA
jgi:small subunit ribosomal protein S1